MSTRNAVTRYRTGTSNSNNSQSHRNYRINSSSSSSSSHRFQHRRQLIARRRNRVLPLNRNASRPWHAPRAAITPPGATGSCPLPTHSHHWNRKSRMDLPFQLDQPRRLPFLRRIGLTPKAAKVAVRSRTRRQPQPEASASAARSSSARTLAHSRFSYLHVQKSHDRRNGAACAGRLQHQLNLSIRPSGSAHSGPSSRRSHRR
jgi:hypothetical protein